MSKNGVTLYEKVSELTGYKPNEVVVIQQNVAKGTTATELSYFLNVCKTMKLNPFNKEVWCYKDKKGNLLIFAGRDGFLSKAQQNPLFNGIRSSEVRENDKWSMDIANNKIVHVIDKPLKSRGEIIGAYALVFRKNGEPTIEFADFSVYNKGYNTWRTHPSEMIKKVAETHALKKAFGISGIQSEYDFNTENGIATAIETEKLNFSKNDVIKHLKTLKNSDDVLNYAMEHEEFYQGTAEEFQNIIKKRLKSFEETVE